MIRKCLLLLCCLFSAACLTAQPVRSFGGAKGPELRWSLLHPKAGNIGWKAAQRARFVTDSLEKAGTLRDGSGGQLDAFRHAYWMALMVQKTAPVRAEQLGLAHEKSNYKQFRRKKTEDGIPVDSMASVMDLYNNSTGIAIGLAWKNDASPKKQSLIARILSAIKTGQLRILKKDAAGNYLTCDGVIIELSNYKNKWSIPKCLVESTKIAH
ncbi:MAG: DUF6973 domain-containing protein [Bacteroidia bacterium]